MLDGWLARQLGVIAQHLKARGLRYWVKVALVVTLSFAATPAIEKYIGWYRVRNRLYQELVERDKRELVPRYTKLVLIGDEEYWKGELAGRRPIRRDYLAKLVNVLDDTDVKVIALDFDLRSPDPNSEQGAPAYEPETALLVEAVMKAAQHRQIVLAKTIWFDKDRKYILQPDVYQSYGLCSRLRADGSWDHAATASVNLQPQIGANIRCGYIALGFDKLVMPLALHMKEGGRLDSFALAVAKASRPGFQAPRAEVYASFIPQKKFLPGEANDAVDTVFFRPRCTDESQRAQEVEARNDTRRRNMVAAGCWSRRSSRPSRNTSGFHRWGIHASQLR